MSSAPMADDGGGWHSEEDYYRRCSARAVLHLWRGREMMAGVEGE